VGVAGIIDNQRGVKMETELMEEFSQMINAPVIGHIPRSDTVQEAERMRGTVVEKLPDSSQAECYRKVARVILDKTDVSIPTPIELKDIMDLLRKYQALE
jgi:nitrogenase iron protein NifH